MRISGWVTYLAGWLRSSPGSNPPVLFTACCSPLFPPIYSFANPPLFVILLLITTNVRHLPLPPKRAREQHSAHHLDTDISDWHAAHSSQLDVDNRKSIRTRPFLFLCSPAFPPPSTTAIGDGDPPFLYPRDERARAAGRELEGCCVSVVQHCVIMLLHFIYCSLLNVADNTRPSPDPATSFALAFSGYVFNAGFCHQQWADVQVSFFGTSLRLHRRESSYQKLFVELTSQSFSRVARILRACSPTLCLVVRCSSSSQTRTLLRRYVSFVLCDTHTPGHP